MVCHCSFRVVHYPDEQRFLGSSDQASDEEFAQFYHLVYCVDCAVPVYRMCLGDAEKIQSVKIEDTEYWVFRCQRCANDAQDQKCLECGQQAGYMTRCRDKGWIHPVCALSYPSIYAISSPKTMEFALSKEVDASTIYDVNTEYECAICNQPSARLLQTDDDSEERAHAYCIFHSSAQAVFETDLERNGDYEMTPYGQECWAAQIIQSGAVDESASSKHSESSGDRKRGEQS